MRGRTRRGEGRDDFCFFFIWPLKKKLHSDLNENGFIVKFSIKYVSLARYIPRNQFSFVRSESLKTENHFLAETVPDGGSLSPEERKV